MTPSDLLAAWSRLLLQSLKQAGVISVVISPGSRSTPLVWAAARSGLPCHHVVDERCAAFFALAQAKLSGQPSVLVCTSGSAPAHYLPALVEAKHSGTPLLVLSADRPFELGHCGAPQTIDQTRLFGEFAHTFLDLGEPDATPDALRALSRKARQAVSLSRGPEPGPVHLNFRARKPLEPERSGDSLQELVDSILDGAPRQTASRTTPNAAALDDLAAQLSTTQRGWLVCGPLAPWLAPEATLVRQLARRTGFLLLAESTSNQRHGHEATQLDAFDLLCRHAAWCDRSAPERILQLGPAPTSGSLGRFLHARPNLPRHVIAPFGWPDPHSTAQVLRGHLDSTLEALLARLPTAPPSAGTSYQQQLSHDNERAWRAAAEALSLNPDGQLGEADAVRTVIEEIPAGSVLALGNSLPVREADTFAKARPAPLSVWSQRGASGIDGLVSSAAGIAAHTRAGRATTLLLGDISFLHDVGGLWAASQVSNPLAIVVLNNGGGRIFELLPIAKAVRADELRSWTTPQDFELRHAAALYRLCFEQVTNRAALSHTLHAAWRRAGATLIEVLLPAAAPRTDNEAVSQTLAARLQV